jgi:hypothetical protein
MTVVNHRNSVILDTYFGLLEIPLENCIKLFHEKVLNLVADDIEQSKRTISAYQQRLEQGEAKLKDLQTGIFFL